MAFQYARRAARHAWRTRRSMFYAPRRPRDDAPVIAAIQGHVDHHAGWDVRALNEAPSMLWNLYIRNGVVYVPTVARTEAGFYMDVDPVRTAPVVEPDKLQAAIASAMRDGNPAIPTPPSGAFPKPLILKHAAVRSWSAFEKSATYWTISEEEGRYRIGRGKRAADRGWEADPANEELLPAGATVNTVAQRVAALLATAAPT